MQPTWAQSLAPQALLGMIPVHRKVWPTGKMEYLFTYRVIEGQRDSTGIKAFALQIAGTSLIPRLHKVLKPLPEVPEHRARNNPEQVWPLKRKNSWTSELKLKLVA